MGATVTPEGEIGDVAVFVESIDLEVPLVRNAAAATDVQLTADQTRGAVHLRFPGLFNVKAVADKAVKQIKTPLEKAEAVKEIEEQRREHLQKQAQQSE